MNPSVKLDILKNVDNPQKFFGPVDRRARVWCERKPDRSSNEFSRENVSWRNTTSC
jgi:hypothetical protein